MNGEYRPINKLSIRRLVLAILIAMLFVLMTFAIASCGGSQGGDGAAQEYYLLLASENWQTYTSQTDIPERLHFKQVGNEGNIYTLTVSLDENEQFTINKLGSDQKYGYSKLFTISDELVLGEDGSIKVAAKGTYALTLDVENDLTYEFTADAHVPEIVSVSISSSKASMTVGDSYPFAAEVLYDDDTKSGNVTWSSDNESVCTVAANGMVTALTEGSAKITATAGNFSDSVNVTVTANSGPVTGVSLDRTELSLELGESDTLVATVEPQNAVNKSVFWSSGDENVVTVTQEGLVTAVGYGETKVTVTTVNGGLIDECVVTVVKHATAIRLGYEHISVVVDGEEKEVSVSFSPEDTTDTEFTFEVANGSDCIQVTQESAFLKIKALKEGSATITVSCKNDPEITAQCEVTVLAKGSAVANMPENKTVVIGSTSSLKVDLENATVQNVAWSVRDESVASVAASDENDTATITAHEFGSTVITAVVSASNGQEYTLTTDLLVADEFFFIYGYGLGAYDWDSADYLTDRNAAEKAGILFSESRRGVYTLTRHFTPDNGFQIIFPNVANFTEHDEFSGEDKWNKNIPSDMVPNTTYYDATRSDRSFVSTKELSQLCVTAAGVYTITLDLTGTSAKVFINKVSVDVTGVSIERKSSSTMLRSGETAVFGFSCTPASATYKAEDWEIDIQSDFADYKQYVEWSVDKESQEITVTAKGDFTAPFALKIKVALNGLEAIEQVSVYPESYEETPVTEISFVYGEGKTRYDSVNVRGGKAWELQVKAVVNPDATIQAVKYSVLGGGNVSVNADGLVKATGLGTFTILATAVGNEAIQTTCTVTFYSDTFYLTGEFNGQTDGFKVCDPSAGDLDSTHSSTKFTQITETYYRLQYHFNGNLDSTVHDGWEFGFQVVFLGMDAKWSSKFSKNSVDSFNSKFYFDFGNSPNVRVKVEGDYIIEVDLSTSTPSWCINKADTPLSRIDLASSATKLHANDAAQITVSTAPKFADVPAGGFTWTIEGNNEGYVAGSFDSDSMTYSISVVKIPHANDATITVICQAGEVSASVTITVVSEHHLVQRFNNDEHWFECADEGCSFTEGRERHILESELTSTDPAGHYSKCKDCDYNTGIMPHTVPLANDGFFDFTQSACQDCGFTFFDISEGVLTRFDAKAEKVRIPASVTVIADGVFEGHTEIKTLSLPQNLVTIGKSAFKDCSSIRTLGIPDTVTSIGHSAFSGVKANVLWGTSPSLKTLDGFDGYLGSSVTIPASVITIDVSAFSGSSLVSVTIPNTVTQLGSAAFRDCTKLIKVVIGTGITIGKGNTFKNCIELQYVYFLSTTFYKIGGSMFSSECRSLKAVYFARQYSQISGINDFILADNDSIKGKCYAFAGSNPGTSVDFGSYSEYFVGTWHYNGESNPDNATVWEMPSQTTTTNITLFIEDRTKYKA